MKLVIIFNNWEPWGNCRGNPPSDPHVSANWRRNSKEIILIIVGAMGTSYNKFDNDISKLRLTNHGFQAEEAQKNALLVTAYIV